MITVRQEGSAPEVVQGHEVPRIEPCGDDSPRIRVGQHDILDDLPGALVPPKPQRVVVTVDGDTGRIGNGALTVIVEQTTVDS